MSWWNPIDQTKWLAGKFNEGFGGVAGGGTDANDYAPGNPYGVNIYADSNNPNNLAAKWAAKNGMAAPSITDQTGQPAPWQLSDKTRQNLLGQQGSIAGKFADQNQNSYAAYGNLGMQNLAGLQAIANGQNSVSGEQLRQAMMQNQAQQQSMAAGASPRNQAMAARTASIQMGRNNAGLAGQQAVAGPHERQQAQQAYGNLLQGLRGQDLSAVTQSRQSAMSGYGAPMNGAPDKDWIDKYGPAIIGGAAAISDRRLKTDIEPGDDAANKAMRKLPAFAYRYKDERHGAGDQLGPMAQDLEKAGLKHTVMNTPGGKMVDTRKLSLANTAMVSALARRLDALEGGGK